MSSRGSDVIDRAGALLVFIALSVGGLAACGDGDGLASDAADATDECPAVTIESSSSGGYTRTPPEPDDLATAVAQGVCSSFVINGYPAGLNGEPSVGAVEGQCIGERLVTELGQQRVREMRLTNPWSVLLFALSNPSIERAEAEQIVDVFADCADHWELLLVRSVTEGASEVSDDSARCVEEELDDDDAREVFVGEIDRAYDDPTQPGATPFPELVEPLVSAMEACLTPEELDRMDWG
jgi:hypothetical protein